MTLEVEVRRAKREDVGARLIRIPLAVRERLGIRDGDEVTVTHGRQQLVLFAAKADRGLVGRLACRLSKEVRTVLDVGPGGRVSLSAEGRVSLDGIDEDAYDLVVVERASANPFQLRPRLIRIALRLAEGLEGARERAKALFDWMQRHVEYGSSERGRGVGYRDSIEVKESGEGVCGEQAFLYVAMARCVGLRANFVLVDRDFRGRAVNHACASVLAGNAQLLVDPAYHTFDIAHREIRVLDDLAAHEAFRSYRRAAG